MENKAEANVVNPQFNVALINKNICVACNKKLLVEVKGILGVIADIAKDFNSFIGDVNDSVVDSPSEDGSFVSNDEYCISKFDGVFNIAMKRDFAKDLSYSISESVKAHKDPHPYANALVAFARKLDTAAEGDFAKLQGSNNRMRFPGNQPIMMYQAVPVYNRYNTRR